MKFFSTKNRNHLVSLKTAVLQSLPPDNGLYMPEHIPVLDQKIIEQLENYSLSELAYHIAHPFLTEDFSDNTIQEIVQGAINFPAPTTTLSDHLHVLELWHGPSLAFKDFGARFMAAVMSRLVEKESQKLTILVATSGDTGGAVAHGFLGVPNVDVIILYPSGKVSPLQEKQLTTLGQNITALEIDGTFDDCQALVKQAFLDKDINDQYLLSSANSINITRLIPQSFYYFEAYKNLKHKENVSFCIPSGNFGNLTAGVFAKRMGLPINNFIAATNINDIVPEFLKTGVYRPKASVSTISNAMDVGNPSNFQRLEYLYDNDHAKFRSDMMGYAYNDNQTKEAILEVKNKFNYTIDPHGAVGYLACKAYLKEHPLDQVVLLETAHPAKFLPVMNQVLGKIDIPKELSILEEKEKKAIELSSEFLPFKAWLLK